MPEETKRPAAAATAVEVEELVKAAVSGVMRALDARDAAVLKQDKGGAKPAEGAGERPPTWIGIVLPEVPGPSMQSNPQAQPPPFLGPMIAQHPVTWIGIINPTIEDFMKFGKKEGQ